MSREVSRFLLNLFIKKPVKIIRRPTKKIITSTIYVEEKLIKFSEFWIIEMFELKGLKGPEPPPTIVVFRFITNLHILIILWPHHVLHRILL